MSRFLVLICFTILFASMSLLDMVSAHLKTKPVEGPSKSTSGGSEASFKDTTGESSITPTGSSTKSESSAKSGSSATSGSSTKSESSTESGSSFTGSASTKQSSAITLTQVETDTSKDFMKFLMDLEKKCPPKEEFKSFFMQLKVTMNIPTQKASTKTKTGLFSRIKSSVGKISDSMAFIRARIRGRAAQAKKALETYQEQCIKAVQDLEKIYSKILIENRKKKIEALTCTPEEQKEIQVTVQKWEQVTSKFIETAVQTESQSSSASSSSGKLIAN